MLALLAWLVAADAHAYLIDTNDARVADHGTFEAELQPAGYYQLVLGDEHYELIAPSLQMSLGIAPGWDVLFLTRGFGVLDGDPEQSPYSVGEQMFAFRALLRDGAYSNEDAEGPSLALQVGVLLPGIEADEGVGATAALLFAQQWDAGTLHLNAWANLTRDRMFELFFSAVFEGPPDWSVRPMFELWIDLVVDGEPMVSGTLGAWADITDELAIEGGIRIGGWDGWADLEVRLAAWFSVELWDPTPGDDEDEADADEEGETDAAAVRSRSPLASR